MNPSPFWLASVHKCVGFTGLKKETTGATVRVSLAAVKTLSCIGDQMKSFLVLSRGHSGANSVVIELVHADN